MTEFKVIIEDDWLDAVFKAKKAEAVRTESGMLCNKAEITQEREGVEPEQIKKNEHISGIVNDFEDGEWRYEHFMDFIWDYLPDTALSYREREIEYVQRHHSIQKLAKSNLRKIIDKDRGKGGEIGEIVLYGIMRKYYGALPIVPKIYHKQNRSDYVHGADSVHIILENNGDFSIWLGEAKFYTHIGNSEIETIVKSVKNTISNEYIEKENAIITDLNDIKYYVGDEVKANEIINFLGHDVSHDEHKKRLHVPILLLYECEITKATTEYTIEYKNKIKDDFILRMRAYYRKQNEELSSTVPMYQAIHFHLILFPVANKEKIVTSMAKGLE